MFDRSSLDPALLRFVPSSAQVAADTAIDMHDVAPWMAPVEAGADGDRIVWFDTADRRITKTGGAVMADRHGWSVVGPWAQSYERVAPGPVDLIVDDRVPDAVMASARALFVAGELEPVATVQIHRRSVDLMDGGGRCVVEVRYEQWHDGVSRDIAERVVVVPAAMAPAIAVKAVRRRLIARGWVEAEVDAEAWHVAPIADEVAVEDQDVEDASMAKTQAAALRTLAANAEVLRARAVAVVAEGDATDVHEARVAARRLRSALATFAAVLDPAWSHLVHVDVKWVGRELGNVRTHQVMLAGLSDHAHEIGGSDGDCLLSIIDEQIVEERRLLARLDEVLGGDRFIAMMSLAEQPVVVDEHVKLEDVVSHSWAKLVAAMETAASGDIADLHEARLSAKRMRYALEAAGDSVSGTARVVRRLTDLQDHLGAMVDGLDLDRWCRQRATTGGTAVAAIVALGRVIERESHAVTAASQRWPRTWARLQRRVAKQWPKW